jgi:hypothetical protein
MENKKYDAAVIISKLLELTRYQTDIIEEMAVELMQYREIEDIEKMDAWIEAETIRKELGE